MNQLLIWNNILIVYHVKRVQNKMDLITKPTESDMIRSVVIMLSDNEFVLPVCD